MYIYSMYGHIPTYILALYSSMNTYFTYILFVGSDTSYIMRHTCGSRYIIWTLFMY